MMVEDTELVPHFRSRAEMDAWWDAQPKVEAEVDPPLRERVKTSMRLSRRTIEGFSLLAKQRGIRSGQTLMKIVLESYLAKSLPPRFLRTLHRKPLRPARPLPRASRLDGSVLEFLQSRCFGWSFTEPTPRSANASKTPRGGSSEA